MIIGLENQFLIFLKVAVLHKFYCIFLIFQAREKEYEDSIAQSGEAVVSIRFVDLILYVPSTIFQLNRDGSSWVEPVLSYD